MRLAPPMPPLQPNNLSLIMAYGVHGLSPLTPLNSCYSIIAEVRGKSQLNSGRGYKFLFHLLALCIPRLRQWV